MDLQKMAAQLRKPEGEEGKKIGEIMNKGNELINQWAIESLNLQPGDHVLEIGMGNGKFTEAILQKHDSITYVGCDYSEVMVAEARRINQDIINTKKVQFEHATADDLPFEGDTFSKIIAVNTLYFWEPERELREIKRVLQPGGLFVLAIRTKEVMDQIPFTQYGFKKYDRDDLYFILEKTGFEIEGISCKAEPPVEWDGAVFTMENLIAVCTRKV